VIAVRGSADGYLVEGLLREGVRRIDGVRGACARPRRLLGNRSCASRCGGRDGVALLGGLAGRGHRSSPTARSCYEGPSRARWWKRLVAGPSGTARLLRRHSVGFPDAGRDPDESPSVHLSGGTPGRALPPHAPCPTGRSTDRPPARAAPGLRRRSPPRHRPARFRPARPGPARLPTDRAPRPAARRPRHGRGLGIARSRCQGGGRNQFGHRTGAVRVHDTAFAVVGLAVAGYEKEAGGLMKRLLEAAEHFGHRLPEMFAGEQRTAGSAPLPHPAACRPAATAAASVIMMLVSLAGMRPDTPPERSPCDPCAAHRSANSRPDRAPRRRRPVRRAHQPAGARHGRGGGGRSATGSVTSYDTTEAKNRSRSCARYQNEAESPSMRPGKGVFIVRQTTMIAACPTTRQPFRPSPSPWTWSC
jgi:hypothetical protein